MSRTSATHGALGKTPEPAAHSADSAVSPPLEASVRLTDRVYERILERIVSGELAIGDRLASENILAARYEVSRAVIREALARLYADGVVVTRRGAGTYVHRQPAREFLQLAPIGGIADWMRCFEFRIALEGEAACLAAQRRSEEHMAAISRAFEKMEKANAAGELGFEEDIGFHAAIAQASRNQMFVQTLNALALHILNGINVFRQLSPARNRKRLLLVQEEHRSVLEAIRDGDEEMARSTMRKHIDNARSRALGYSAEP